MNMEIKDIKTFEDFADVINAENDWLPEFDEIIRNNGWIDQTGDEFGICSDGYDKLEFDCNGKAIIVPDENSVGRRLVALRKKKGYNIRKVAELTGMNISSLSFIEQGKRQPQVDTLQRILKVLDAEMEIKEG